MPPRPVSFLLLLSLLVTLASEGSGATDPPLPPADSAALNSRASAFLGIPYRDDGALDESGRYTTFSNPERTSSEPGLNCSGLVLALSRALLGCRQTLAEAGVDRRGDSGAVSPLGQDWDYGWDLILNLSDGFVRNALLPGGAVAVPEAMEEGEGPGFLLGSAAAWQSILPRLKPGRVYLGSMNRPGGYAPYRLLHHHVVVLLPDGEGRCWLYQATARDGVHRLDLRTAAGLRRLQEQFPDRSEGPERILILEVAPAT